MKKYGNFMSFFFLVIFSIFLGPIASQANSPFDNDSTIENSSDIVKSNYEDKFLLKEKVLIASYEDEFEIEATYEGFSKIDCDFVYVKISNYSPMIKVSLFRIRLRGSIVFDGVGNHAKIRKKQYLHNKGWLEQTE